MFCHLWLKEKKQQQKEGKKHMTNPLGGTCRRKKKRILRRKYEGWGLSRKLDFGGGLWGFAVK
jgi:hypothetical protein